MKTIEPGKNKERANRDSAKIRPSTQPARGGSVSWGGRSDVPPPPPETPEAVQRKLDTAFGTQERAPTFPRWSSMGEAANASPQPAARDSAVPASPLVQSVTGSAAVVQRKGGAAHSATLEIAAEGVKGSGQPLPYLQRIQQAFGPHDLSGVRSFATDQASLAARRIGAEAYTTGDRIAFADGNPSLHTVAHEAAHVVQQRAGVQLKGGIGQEGDVYERHADAVADAVVSGRSAAPLLAQAPEAIAQGAQARPAAVQRIKAEDMGLLMAMAELEAPGFHSLMKKVAATAKCEYKYRKGLKSVSRSVVKAQEYEADLKGKGDKKAELHGVESMVDMVAGSLIFKSLGELAAGYGTLQHTLADKGAEIVRLKNRMHKAHLRDLLLNIKMPSGFIVELQLHLAPTISAKMGKPVKADADPSGAKGGHSAYTTHDAYDYQRIIEPFMQTLKKMTFTAFIDPTNEYEKHELAKERTLLKYMDAGTKKDVSAHLKLEPYKKKMTEEVDKLSRELGDIYDKISVEIMGKAWDTIEHQRGHEKNYKLIMSTIKDFDPGVRQNLKQTRRQWPEMKRFRSKPDQGRAEIDRLIRTYQVDAKSALKVPTSGDSANVKILKKLQNELAHVRNEKKVKHADTVVDDSPIDSLIVRMAKIIKMLEQQEEVERIVVRIKKNALRSRRRAEAAKAKAAAASATESTTVDTSTE